MDLPPSSPPNSACNCCLEPPTVAPVLEYVSVTKECTGNCGFEPCTSDASNTCSPNFEELTVAEQCSGQKYLTKVFTATDGHTETTTCAVDEEGICVCNKTCEGSFLDTLSVTGEPADQYQSYCSGSLEATAEITTTFNPDCTTTESIVCSGESNISCSDYNGPDCLVTSSCQSTYANSETGTDTFPGSNSAFPCVWTGSSTASYCGDEPENYDVNYPCVEKLEPITYTRTPALTESTTTEFLTLSEGVCTPAEFPAFPAFINCTPDGETPPDPPELEVGQAISPFHDTAYIYQHPYNAAIRSERRIKIRVAHPPTGTCYLKVWLRKVIQPYKWEDCDTGFSGDVPRTASWTDLVDCDGNPCTSRWSTDGPPTTEDLDTYEWTGTGSPCFSDETRLFTACENLVYSTDPIELTAGENQGVSVEFKWSAVQGYEPDWPDVNGCQGCKPNGFPIPNSDDCPVCAAP